MVFSIIRQPFKTYKKLIILLLDFTIMILKCLQGKRSLAKMIDFQIQNFSATEDQDLIQMKEQIEDLIQQNNKEREKILERFTDIESLNRNLQSKIYSSCKQNMLPQLLKFIKNNDQFQQKLNSQVTEKVNQNNLILDSAKQQLNQISSEINKFRKNLKFQEQRNDNIRISQEIEQQINQLIEEQAIFNNKMKDKLKDLNNKMLSELQKTNNILETLEKIRIDHVSQLDELKDQQNVKRELQIKYRSQIKKIKINSECMLLYLTQKTLRISKSQSKQIISLFQLLYFSNIIKKAQTKASTKIHGELLETQCSYYSNGIQSSAKYFKVNIEFLFFDQYNFRSISYEPQYNHQIILLVKQSKQGHYNIKVRNSIEREKFITSRFQVESQYFNHSS